MDLTALNVVINLQRRIDKEQMRLNRFTDLITAITQELDGLPRGNAHKSRIELIATEIVATQNTIDALKAVKTACRAELYQMLDALIIEDNILSVIYQRYCNCKLFRDIGIKLGYSERRVYQLHNQGLMILGIT